MVLLPSTDEHEDNPGEHEDNSVEHEDNPDEHDDDSDLVNLVYVTKLTSIDIGSVLDGDLPLIRSCFVGNFRCFDRQDTIIGNDTHSIAVTIFLFQGETEVDGKITITSAALEEEMKSRNVIDISLRF